MTRVKFYTRNYKHQYSFNFKGKEYNVHSVVRLTPRGKRELGARSNEAILTERFIGPNNKTWWKYQFKSIEITGGIIDVSTDIRLDKMVEEVIVPASTNHMQREVLGVSLNPSTTAIKHTKKDWEIPEVRTAWLIYIAIFFGVAIFKDWYVQLLIRIGAGWFLGLYRQAYVNAYTTYTYPEDTEITRKKLEILYGINNTNN